MTHPTDYPWNIEIGVGGMTFFGPGMESEEQATALKDIAIHKESVQDARVVEQ